MVDSTCLGTFFQHNQTDLAKFLNGRVPSSTTSEDLIQDFGLYCAKHDSLAKWDCSRSSFSTYVFHVLQWQFPKGPVPELRTLNENIVYPTSPDLGMRVKDLKRYIEKHGGDYVERLLAHLQKRIEGKPLTEDDKYVEIKYHAIVKAFKSAEMFGE